MAGFPGSWAYRLVRLNLIASETMYRARHGGRYACSVDMRLNLGRPIRERYFVLTVAGKFLLQNLGGNQAG